MKIKNLRASLTPFFCLAGALKEDADFDTKELVEICIKNIEDIRTHLTDYENFYSKEKVGVFPTEKVCFFKAENGKYLTTNGMEITEEMLATHTHYIGLPWSYIVLS